MRNYILTMILVSVGFLQSNAQCSNFSVSWSTLTQTACSNGLWTLSATLDLTFSSGNASFQVFTQPDGGSISSFYEETLITAGYSYTYLGGVVSATVPCGTDVTFTVITYSNPNFGGNTCSFPDGNNIIVEVDYEKIWGRNVLNQNEVHWTTISEVNSDHFEIQRKSAHESSFETIGEISSSGNSTELLAYEFIDEQPHAGLNYYRLCEINYNGDKSYSDIIEIRNEADESDMKIFPNPANNTLNIQTSSSASNIHLFNNIGELVASYVINQDYQSVDISALPRGLYVVQFLNGEKVIGNQKVIVLRE